MAALQQGQRPAAVPSRRARKQLWKAQGAADSSVADAAEEKTYEPTTLTFWNGFTSTDGEVLQQIVDDFNATNEWNITIEMDVMPWATFNEKLPCRRLQPETHLILCSVPQAITHRMWKRAASRM